MVHNSPHVTPSETFYLETQMSSFCTWPSDALCWHTCTLIMVASFIEFKIPHMFQMQEFLGETTSMVEVYKKLFTH